MLFGVTTAMAVEQCFFQAGTYGNLVVAESGSGCGTIVGSSLHLGDGNADESCEFTFTPAIDGSSITVEMLALNESYPTYAEEIIIGMNGAQVDFLGGGDLISGGLKPSTGGVEAPTIGGITEGTGFNGLVKFSNAPASVTSLNLQYNWIIGGPNGVLIQVCADDAGVGSTTYTVGGTVSDLTGTGLELQNAGADTLAITDNGSFTFPTELAVGTPYVVAVSTQPTGQTCTVSDGSGTISDQDVTDVAVNCVDDPEPFYTINGVTSGLGPNSVTLQNNGTDDLEVNSNGPFVFATALPEGSAYDVTVSVQPSGQICTVTNGFGTVSDTDVLGVDVNCVDDVIPAPTPATPVPTMSEWALIMLSMLLGLMVFANRKRLF